MLRILLQSCGGCQDSDGFEGFWQFFLANIALILHHPLGFIFARIFDKSPLPISLENFFIVFKIFKS